MMNRAILISVSPQEAYNILTKKQSTILKR